MTSDPYAITDPAELLRVLEKRAPLEPLDPDVERIVAKALADPASWPKALAASRALRLLQRFHAEDGTRAPERVALLLRAVRDAMRARTSSRAPR
jgi:hypothetical protein